MSEINTFEDLEVWKRGCQLAVDLHVASHASRDFGMKDHMQRAATSIPSNIAEGRGRDSSADFIRFAATARGRVMNFALNSTFRRESPGNPICRPLVASEK